MNDLISRQAAMTIPVLPKEHRDYISFELDDIYEQGWNECQKFIAELPSEDRPQGEWIEMGQNEDGTHNVKCNQCDSAYKMRGHAKSISTKLKYRFCPHCGARMKGADDETIRTEDI